MSIRLNFCRSVPPEFLRSFLCILLSSPLGFKISLNLHTPFKVDYKVLDRESIFSTTFSQFTRRYWPGRLFREGGMGALLHIASVSHHLHCACLPACPQLSLYIWNNQHLCERAIWRSSQLNSVNLLLSVYQSCVVSLVYYLLWCLCNWKIQFQVLLIEGNVSQ